MKNRIPTGLLFAWAVTSFCSILPATSSAKEPVDWVNPFIGTQESPVSDIKGYWASGCCFPGAAAPFGLLQFSPDTVKQIPGGYDYSDNRIKAFSLTHFSGRGFLYMQDIGIMPVPGRPDAAEPMSPARFVSTFSHTSESATPGFYKVRLDSGIMVDLTVTPRTGMARFTFPAGTNENSLLFNLANNDVQTASAEVHVTGDREVSGWVQSKVGSGNELFKVYFVARFDHPFAASGTWTGTTLTEASTSATGRRCGAYVVFAAAVGATVQARIGLSFTSTTNAVNNLKAENGGEKWDFEGVRQQTRLLWNQKLDAIQASGGTDRTTTIFYTALYHCLFHPNILDDVNGEYPGIDGAVHTVKPGHHHYTHFDGWGLYKTRAPLHGLLFPTEASDMAQSLVDDAMQDKGGGIPRWNQVNRNSNGMTGDGNVAVIAAMNAFGATDFDTAQAVLAMKRNALDPKTTSDGHFVRPRLADYLSLGYVPQESDEHAAAATLEYAVTDTAAGYFLRAHGDTAGAETCFQRTGTWTNLFDPESGYLFPKKRDGTWATRDPASGRAWAEGTASQYTWAVPAADAANLVRVLGREKMEARLDDFFARLDAGPDSTRAYMGNEPCEGAPWLYEFLGRPDKTITTFRRIERELYTTAAGGMPGQDDGGGLASWYVFCALGFYPAIPGAAGVLVGSPLFPDIQLKSEDGRRWHIVAPGAGDANPYVSSMKIDSQENRSLWVPLAQLSGTKAHEIQFKLAPQPDPSWGTRPEDLPARAAF